MSITSNKDLPWWKKTIVYQIYPRSFKDSTGNGIGDLLGIISKLDYLQNLGIETIWFSPFFTSPQADHGYDVSDYRSIAPEYGTMADCEKLIQEIHNREMYVVFDLVLNHTSDQHPWFLISRSNKDNPKRDWYIWRNGQKPGGKKPPNNWKAMVGGSGWHYDELTDQWYWAQFLPFQPDLNYRNPDVKKEMFDTVRYWLDKGVDGFRLDIINTVFEDETLQNNPFSRKYFPSEEDDKSFFQDKIHTMNHPDNFIFVKELRSVLDEYSDPERFLVGEIDASIETLKRYCGDEIDKTKTNGLHLAFLFKSLNAELDASIFHKIISEYEQYFPEPYTPTWVFSNHDQMRRISKLGNDRTKAKLNATLQLTARGVPYIYYGEEIGMSNHKLPLKTAEDPIGQKYSWLPQFMINLLTRSGSISLNRDNCRTPMQWISRSNAGFCSEELIPWLPISPGYNTINVDSEESNPDSLLNCYKALLKLRKDTPALHSGLLNLLPPFLFGSFLSYQRIYDEQVVQIWLNFSNKLGYASEIGKNPTLLFSTIVDTNPIKDSKLHLEPFQGVVLEINP
ncbi:MAG: alpha-glucosidase [Candidatus Thorarchaeota archaeon]